jgi:uncharacterized membrane protein YoaK (UPF0700 family)
MQTAQHTRVPLLRDSLLLLLAGAAGSLDAISYLGLGHVFTANMTGNTVLLGVALSQRDIPAVLRNAVALVGFGVGVALGTAIAGRGRPGGRWPRIVTVTLAVELAALLLYALIWHLVDTPSGGSASALILLSAGAMGIQSEAVRCLKISGVSTTYITGTLTNLTASLVGWLRAATEEALPVSADAANARLPGLPAAVWGVYLLGAIAGGAAALHRQPGAIWAPAGVVALVVVIAALQYGRRG